jgi:hypothetical protein
MTQHPRDGTIMTFDYNVPQTSGTETKKIINIIAPILCKLFTIFDYFQIKPNYQTSQVVHKTHLLLITDIRYVGFDLKM